MITIREVVEHCERKGKHDTFSLTYIKQSGELCEFKDVRCLAVFKAETMRIIFPNNEVRKIIINSIIRFNGQEIIH